MYITENNNGDVYESDWIASSVVVVTRFGQYRFSYFGQDSQQTFSPSRICTPDLRGNKHPGLQTELLQRAPTGP